MWETQHNSAGLDYFKTLILLEISKTQNQHQEEFCAFSGVTRLCQKNWMCKKQTSVSHSSTEAEIISLDAGLRKDGIPALTLWDLVIEVFRSEPNKTEGPKRELRGNPSAIVVKSVMHNTHPNQAHQRHSNKHWVTFRAIQRILVPVLCRTSLRTMRR